MGRRGGQQHDPAALPQGGGKKPIPTVQDAGWAPGSVWTGPENLVPSDIPAPGRPARSDTIYRLSYSGPTSSAVILSHIFLFPHPPPLKKKLKTVSRILVFKAIFFFLQEFTSVPEPHNLENGKQACQIFATSMLHVAISSSFWWAVKNFHRQTAQTPQTLHFIH